jgi:Ca2+:H+ antiporter
LLLLCVEWLCFRFKTHGYLGDFEDDEGDRFYPRPNLGPAFFVVLIALPCPVLCVRYILTSVNGVVQSEHISRTLIGLVLLPSALTPPTFVNARKNKMDQAIEMTLGASVNITLVTLPVLILTGWAIHQPMSMQFQLLETITLAGDVFLTASVVSDGKSSYFEGLMCLGM